MTLRFDVEATCRLSELMDLEDGVAEILGINPSGLKILDVENSCLIVTFLIQNSMANILFRGEKNMIFLPEQVAKFQVLSTQWLKCKRYEQ